MKHHAILKQAKLLGAVSAKARAAACSYDDIEYALSHSIYKVTQNIADEQKIICNFAAAKKQ
jgi:hypothetical protein